MLRRIFTLIIAISSCLLMLISLSSCHQDEPEVKKQRKMTMLVYAVVSNLDIESDKNEMLMGSKEIDLEENSLFVYQVYKTGLPQLLELSENSQGKLEFQVVKVYDRELYSTDPERISEVISDVTSMNPAEKYGLIFWSHGTGWSPSFSTHGDSSIEDAQAFLPSVQAFGADLDLDRDPSYTDKTDIDELAAAVPDNKFEFIWFDVCYMGGIETVYQFRKKCRYFVGLPTEDPGNGMPYHLTLPYLLTGAPDCVAAAKEFFNYYESGKDGSWAVATIGVYDMAKIEPVADYCKATYSGATKPSSYGLQIYSRGSNGPFYDFGQYTRRMASTNSAAPSTDLFKQAMDDFVIYKAATQYDFAGREISQDNFSGLSCHLYDPDSNDSKTDFYRSLDWFKRVYE